MTQLSCKGCGGSIIDTGPVCGSCGDTAALPLSDREQFNAVLSAGPLLLADAIVVLCGEDAGPRLATAVGLLMQGAAKTIVVTGGLEKSPHLISAETCYAKLMGKGVAPDRIVVENEAKNTWEQAQKIVALAREKEWRRLLVVASPYHAPRAFLTFVKALDDAGLGDDIQVVSVPCAQSPWFQSPEGSGLTRLGLAMIEADKVVEYGALGHVATYQRGLEYLRRWEGK